MCSINHNLEAIFIHVPKTAGTFVRENLEKYHGFKFYSFKRPDHDLISKPNPYNHRYKQFAGSKDLGIYQYAKTSNYINRIINMNETKWDNYKIFCFVRNPYDRVVSAWNYLNKKHDLSIDFSKYIWMENEVSDFEYIHMFMPQYKNLIDSSNNLKTNFIGRFEKLYEDFQNILEQIGCKNNNFDLEKKNNFEHENITQYISNQKILGKINELFKKDFELFGYKLIENYDDFYYFYTKTKLLDNKFYDTYQIYPKLKLFEDNFDLIKNELEVNLDLMHTGLLKWKDKSESFNEKNSKHALIPIYGFGEWSKFSSNFPITTSIIKQIEDIQIVIFIKLAGKTRIVPHYG